MKRWIIFAIAFVIACAVPILQRQPPTVTTAEGRPTDATWHLQAVEAGSYRTLLQAEIDRYEACFSTSRSDSDLMRYTLGIDKKPAPSLAKLLELAHRLQADESPLIHSFDLSGIAKGYAVDQIVAGLLGDIVFELEGPNTPCPH